MYRFTALLSLACAVFYLGTGAFFLVDPSSEFPNGSDAYWQALAEGSLARTGFLFCFGAAALCAIGVLPALKRYLGLAEYHPAFWGMSLGLLGYAVTAITYFRLLAGEPERARAVANGTAEAKSIITSFSLSLDTQGWLIFGCVSVFLFLINAAGLQSRRWPVFLCLLGMLAAALYAVAFLGLLLSEPAIVTLAAAVGLSLIHI